MQRPAVVVAHVNHQLRQQSDVEETFLRDYCNQLNLPLVVAHWLSKDHPKVGIEAAARRFRYHFFEQVMTEHHATLLATAHQEDEMAETGLMRLVEGRSMMEPLGIAWKRSFGKGDLIRPLLGISKASIRDYARRQDLQTFEDETNTQLTTKRNRFRHQILPLLASENPSFKHDFANNLNDQAAVNIYLQQQASLALVGIDHSVDALLRHPMPTLLLLRQAFSERVTDALIAPIELAAWHNAVNALMSAKSEFNVDLGSGWQLCRRYDEFTFKRSDNNQQKNASRQQPVRETMVTLNKWTAVTGTCQVGLFDARQVVTMQPNFLSVHLHVDTSELPLLIRQAKATDQLALKDGQHQSVRRVLINQKLPLEERSHQLIVTTVNNEPLWLVGRRVAVTKPDHQLVEICVRLRQGVEHE
ncbi:tRNA lysidine(34) synthetase TilS [Furfurilactobacillus rossiae]